jgi:hypothetical protein
MKIFMHSINIWWRGSHGDWAYPFLCTLRSRYFRVPSSLAGHLITRTSIIEKSFIVWVMVRLTSERSWISSHMNSPHTLESDFESQVQSPNFRLSLENCASNPFALPEAPSLHRLYLPAGIRCRSASHLKMSFAALNIKMFCPQAPGSPPLSAFPEGMIMPIDFRSSLYSPSSTCCDCSFGLSISMFLLFPDLRFWYFNSFLFPFKMQIYFPFSIRLIQPMLWFSLTSSIYDVIIDNIV